MNSETKELEGKTEKTLALKAKPRSTRSKSKTFGDVELRYVSFDDLIFFAGLLDQAKDDRGFVIQALHHQLVLPKVSLAEFSQIPDNELVELARDFVRHDPHTFEYFEDTTDAEVFASFREAIKTYLQRFLEQLQATFGPIIQSTKKIFENFDKQYADILKQAAVPTSYIIELGRGISKVAEQLGEYTLGIAESVRPVIEQYQLIARVVSEALVPQINLWRTWVEEYGRPLFDSYFEFWKGFQQQYDIAEQEAIQILRRYKWFVTPSLPLSFVFEAVRIGRRMGSQRKAMNWLFVDYFSSDDFANLGILVDGWETNPIFKPRMRILRDCVSVLRTARRGSNPSNVVLPTLIAQIDGIQAEFMRQEGLSFDLRERRWKDATGKCVDWKVWYSAQTSNQRLLDLANDIFLNILFQKSQPGQPLETPFTFNRHKIIHGEHLRYGRIDNAIRAFLILDLLATLSNDYLGP